LLAVPDGVRCRTAGNAIGGPGAVTEPRQSEESLIALAEILVTKQSLEKTLRQVLELTCAALPGGDEGGITLLEAGGPDTTIATSDVARRVDRSQYAAEGGGPCLDAYRQQQIFRIDSTLVDQLQQALATRGAIEQATGIIIAQRGCSAGDALHLLTMAAQRSRLTLAEVGAELVQRTSNQDRPA